MTPPYFPLTRQVAPATSLPLSLEDAKAHLRQDGTEEDAYIEALLRAAAGWWEIGTNTPLMEAEYVTVFGGFSSELHGLKQPVTQVLSVAYATDLDVNTAGVVGDYTVSEGRPGVLLYTGSDVFPVLRRGYAEPVRIRYTAGYKTAEEVPALIKQALLLTVGHWYEYRQNVVVGLNIAEVPQTAQMILGLHREHVL